MVENERLIELKNISKEFDGTTVLDNINLCLGERKTRVKTGGSFCLHPKTEHWLENPNKTKARILWVSTPPSF